MDNDKKQYSKPEIRSTEIPEMRAMACNLTIGCMVSQWSTNPFCNTDGSNWTQPCS